MKRLLKWAALLTLLLAVLGVVARFVLGRRSNDDDEGGGWQPPAPPEPPQPSTLAEEYISTVDEPIAPPAMPEPSTEGEELPREVLGAPEPDTEREPELVPSAELTSGLEMGPGDILPDEVLAEDRDEGIPTPVEAVAEASMAETGDAADEPLEGHTELTSGLEAGSADILPDEVLAKDRDEGIPAPVEAVAEPAISETMAWASAGVEEQPPAAEPAGRLDTGLSDVAREPASSDFLTQAFERLAATPEGAREAPPPPVFEDLGTAHDAGEAAAAETVEPSGEPWRPVSESEAGPATETPRAETAGEAQTWHDLDELAARPPELFAPPADDGSGLESIEQALSDVSPERIQLAPARNAESYLDEGNVYFNVGQYSLAIERYTHALELDNGLIAAFYNRANARTRSGDFDNALGDYDRALELQPDDADALNNRGMLHLYRTNYGAALRDFNAALAADPTDTTVMVNRGLAHLHGGEPHPALDDFRAAIAIDDGDAAAHYGAAQAAVALGDRDGALSYIERAVRLDPAYAREAAADPRLTLLQGDGRFMRLLRESGARST